MKLKLLQSAFTVCKVENISGINFNNEYTFFSKTDDELSLVCRQKDVPQNTTEREDGWRAFKICGVLDFSLIGILSKITGLLADEKVGVFAISTYNTDYILVKDNQADTAVRILGSNGYEIV